MKRNLLLFLLLLATASYTEAHPYVPAIEFVQNAENVYLTRVTSIDGGTVTFTVIDVLRGNAKSVLILKPNIEGGMAYSLQSEWLLASCASGYSKDSVGVPMEGFCAWIPNLVVTENGQPFIKTGPISPVFGTTVDTASDGTQGLTLDHVKHMLKPSK